MKKSTKIFCPLVVLCGFLSLRTTAQFSLTGQVRTRTEVRDGQGSPLPMGAKPAFFTSQRTRLSAGYNAYRLKFGVVAQDVRVWGQDVSTINRTTTQELNGVLMHEAWAELGLTDTTVKNKSLALKLGRQELVYDDQRLLGNLDWLQQGRRHDAALLRYEAAGYRVHLGAAFNQNRELSSGTIYNNTPPAGYAATTNGGSMYKSMVFLYAAKKLRGGNASFLFLNDAFSSYRSDPLTSAKVYDSSTWSRATTGLYFSNSFKKLTLTASAYYQFGDNAAGQKVQAHLFSLAGLYTIGKKWNAGGGVDYYSGGKSGNTSNAFDPLYGTPHKFGGLMDYFFVANGFGRNGLVDYFLRGKWKASEKLALTADVHQFHSPASSAGVSSGSLGQEIDLVANYHFTRQIGIEAGYSRYFTTGLLAAVKGIANAKPQANWAYVMINVNPQLF